MPQYLLFISLFFSVFFSTFSHAGFFSKKSTQPSFLKAEEAFVLNITEQAQQIQLNWKISEGYYLYKKEIQLQNYDEKKGRWHTLLISLPDGEKYLDEFFGEVEIYRNQLLIDISKNLLTGKKLKINYQGCTIGLCYPPESRIVDLIEITANSQEIAIPKLISEQEKLVTKLNHSKYTIFIFFLLGIGLAFTPCVLPMLPLLSAIVIGRNQRPNSLKALMLSMVYVQGMAVTYTLLGLLVASIGLPFQIALQSPYVLISLSIVFILLSLSMFGFFEIQLPTQLQNRLNQYSQRQTSGAFSGVFIMGMIAGLVASPCTTAPLSAALLYVAQSGNLITGGLSLYLLALGMGVPLILITVFGNRILPKSGTWLIRVKELFGLIMLLLPVILLSRIFPDYELFLIRAWIASIFIWLTYHLGKYWLGWLIIILCMVLCFGIYHQPLQQWISKQFTSLKTNQSISFKKIHTYDELTLTLQQNPKRIAMLDLYADWCIACKEFEKYTFSDRKVQQKFEQVLLLQVDMTKNSTQNQEIMSKLQVLGLPTILFFNQQGQEISGSRITGFIKAEAFEDWLNQLL